MGDLENRLANLTPQKREALARILKSRAGASVQKTEPSAAAAAPAPAEDLLTGNAADIPVESQARKASWKSFYDKVSAQLNSNVFGQFSFFLNYGYVPEIGRASCRER